MQRVKPAEYPEAYVAALDGWQRDYVQALRAAVHGSAALEERIKWGHLVYLSDGPVLLIRAEASRVLFGFWRGQQLRAIEPRLKPGGKYEMAAIEMRAGDPLPADAITRRLVTDAVALNHTLGDPTHIVRAR